MKKFILSLSVAALALSLVAVAPAQQAGPRGGGPGFGQGGPGGKGAAGNRMGRMAKIREEIMGQLNLNADQKKKIKALDEKQRETMMKAFQEAKGDREKMRETMKTNREEYQKAMKGILTKEQLKKYEELLKDARKKMGGPGGPGGAGAGRPGGGAPGAKPGGGRRGGGIF